MPAEIGIAVAAHNEADRLPDTLAALAEAFPGARVVVADDGSTDATRQVALAAGAEVTGSPRRIGKGGAVTLAAERLLEDGMTRAVVLCDGDLGRSARELPRLLDALECGEGDLAVAAFARRAGGGFGVAVGFARRAIRRLTGLELDAPISGQRALRPEVLREVLPFAHRAGFRVVEVELELEHRATGRDPRGFMHRARQLAAFARVYASRR